MAKTPAPEKKNELSAFVTAATNRYMSEIGNLSANLGLGNLTDTAKRCGSNLMIYIAAKYGKEEFGLFKSAELIQALQFVTINELDVFSGQVFVDVRDEWKDKVKTGKKTLAATVQGTGLENMVRRFGVGVKSLHGPYIVHDGDEFAMPCFDGTKMTPPVLKPKLDSDSKKALMVYYLIEKNDGTTEMASASRETVARNLGAAILNASLKNKEKVDRDALMAKIDGKSLDELLADNYLASFISPAYRSPSSREQMIVTKMRKNALLHYTRDLGARSLLGAESLKGDGDMLASNVVATSTGEEEEVGEKIADIAMDEPKKLEGSEDAKPAADEPKADENGEVKPEPVKVAAAIAEDDPFDI